MRSGGRGNALLVELMIVVMFFMLTTSVLLEIFAKSHQMSSRAELITESLVTAQNMADRLYSAEDPEALLAEMGFTRSEDRWSLPTENALFEVVSTPETGEAGTFRRQEVRVITDGEQLYALPCSRWEVLP